MPLLSDEFISRYNGVQPPFGGNGLGHFVYLRTYSRWLPEKMRRETWQETVQRVTEYSMSLYQGPATKQQLVSEAELLYDHIFNLRTLPAGRSLWVGGTPSAARSPMSQFNCSFLVIDELVKFSELFMNLMLGSGVGFRVLQRDVAKLPKLNTKIVLANKPYNPKPKLERREDTVAFEGDGTLLIVVGDSREGWVESLRLYFDAMVRDDLRSIIINYDSVRPYGEVLKTFGGRASGHTALRDMFSWIHTFVTEQSSGGVLSPLNCMDIGNIIGYYVVAGGVRRTAEICIFSPEDKDILNAKIGLYEEGHENYGKFWRSMSNNSIFFEEKPAREYLRSVMKSIQHSAEPGFVNAAASETRRTNYKGTNPCAEILLDDRGTCNLSEVNVAAYVDEDGYVDGPGLSLALRLAVRIGMRMTNVTLEHPLWDAVQKRDRLVGPSLDGWEEASARAAKAGHNLEQILGQLHAAVHEEVYIYAHEMRIPVPLLVTTIKPSGTLAQLPTISSGVHRPFAPFYIRRVRISSADPLAKVMLDLGYKIYPENGEGPSAAEFNQLTARDQWDILKDARTWVIEFPVRTSATELASEESALSQLERYFTFQKFWTDHNTSITIYVGDTEWEPLFDEIYERWDEYIGVSFLPKNDAVYPLMPYEAIDEEEYNLRASQVVASTVIDEMLHERERADAATELLDDGCELGVCPIR